MREKRRNRSSLTGSMIGFQCCMFAGSAVVNGRVCVVVVVEVFGHSFEDLKWSGWYSQPLRLLTQATENKIIKFTCQPPITFINYVMLF